MWKSHWNLEKDPFAEGGPAYVSLPSHDEAIARLVHAIESSERRAFLTANAGLGKTTVLHQAFNEARGPGRRFALVSCPHDGTLLVAMLAERLAERVGREPSRLAAWRAFERAVRLATIQAMHVVIGIDNCESANIEVRRAIESLANLAAGTSARITVIQSGRPGQKRPGDFDRPWTPAITLESLTRSQAEALLTTKLKDAGRDEPVFTARASRGYIVFPRASRAALEQLATLCLMAAAASGLEVVSPELVDSVEQRQNEEAEKRGIKDRRPTASTRAG